VKLHREIRGEGPPVVLVHAGGMDSRMWAPLADRLEGSYTLVMPDQRGSGRTPLPDEPLALVDDLLELLDGLGLERAAFVGASMGGWTVMELVTAAPQRVSAIALLAGSLDLEPWSDEIQAFRAEEEALVAAGDIEGAVALGVRTWVRDSAVAELAAEMMRDAFAHQVGVEVDIPELPVDLEAVTVPLLAVSGGLDLPDFARIADHVVATVPGAQRAEVPDTGHLIALERPDAAADLLAPFLSRALG
jgi:pimeloyl-ACP methyl ester carboxylesterase